MNSATDPNSFLVQEIFHVPWSNVYQSKEPYQTWDLIRDFEKQTQQEEDESDRNEREKVGEKWK